MLSLHISFFLNIKTGLELVSLPHFLHNFWRKIFFLLYSINWPHFIAWLPLLCEILGNMFIAIVCKSRCDVMVDFKVNLTNQAIFPTWPKSRDKSLNMLRTKRAFRMKLKTFFIIFKELSIKQITQIFLEGESPTLT